MDYLNFDIMDVLFAIGCSEVVSNNQDVEYEVLVGGVGEEIYLELGNFDFDVAHEVDRMEEERIFYQVVQAFVVENEVGSNIFVLDFDYFLLHYQLHWQVVLVEFVVLLLYLVHITL